jgi:uncharacterized iron-regulated protein
MKGVLLAIVALLPFVQTPLSEASKPAEIGEQHYRIYRSDGTAATLDDVLAASQAATVTFLGEPHDDPVAHYLEEQILRRTWDSRLALSLEMFERDVQNVLDEYLAGLISEPNLIASARPWKNYATDYRPLVEFAKEKGMVVIAANAPRRYVDRVSHLGAASLDQIGPEGRRFLPPLPYSTASDEYKTRFVRTMQGHGSPGGSHSPESSARSLEAQSLWDASMAYSIAEFLNTHPGKRVLQVNGSFHTAQHLGTVEQLLRYRPQTSVLVVTIVSDKSFPAFDAASMSGEGDFVIVTDPAVPRSFRVPGGRL